MKTINSKVMTIANKMVSNGCDRVTAMIKAWALVKLPKIISKVSGVTFGNRQTALEHLTKYSPESITIELAREPHNQYDRNAVAVVAKVNGKGYKMGYMPRYLAFMLAPLMDMGKAVKAAYIGVTGGFRQGYNYGLNMQITI